MKFQILAIYLTLLSACNQPTANQNNPPPQTKTLPILSTPKKTNKYRIIHIFVALCDNQHQGIIKVPPLIGNGKDPENNLYWGCDLGTKTFIKQQKDWKLVQTSTNPRDKVLERCIFKHKTENAIIIADAYDGEFIKKCTIDYLQAAAGNYENTLTLNQDTIACGGKSDLLAYIGHDGLMEFKIEENLQPHDTLKRETITLACITQKYFAPYLKQTKAKTLICTTGLMAPEAYTLIAAINGWIAHKTNPEIRELSAQAYNQYQKCGITAARNLLVNQ
jgi:hypothetical protein